MPFIWKPAGCIHPGCDALAVHPPELFCEVHRATARIARLEIELQEALALMGMMKHALRSKLYATPAIDDWEQRVTVLLGDTPID